METRCARCRLYSAKVPLCAERRDSSRRFRILSRLARRQQEPAISSATSEAQTAFGKVTAQGSSSTAREYAFVDAQPLAGTCYYRLRQVDADGSAAYSPVVAVRGKGLAEATIYPNPSAQTVVLPAATGALHYRIFNALGQTLLGGEAAGNARLDLSALPAGTFLLELTDAGGRRTQRLVRE